MSPADASSDLPGPLSSEAPVGRREDSRDALESWRAALESLQQGARSLTDELTALRQGVAGGLRELRKAELWEAGGSPEQVVETLATGLEAAQARVAARAAALVDAQRRAAEAATTAVRRLVNEARQAAREGAVPEDLTPVLERLESLGELTRGLITTLRSDIGTLQDRLQGALSEGAAGAERASREILETLGAVRASLEDVRLDMKDVSEPALGVLRVLQTSMEELSKSVEARLEATQTEIRWVRDEMEQRLNAPAGVDDKTARQALARNASALKSEVHALRERIEGWGKPRTAPRLAEEVKRLETRVNELDQAIEERLAPQVANRVRASLDRRLRSLLGDLPDQLRESIAEAVQEAVSASAEAARGAVREAAEEAVREATESIREALRQPASEPQRRWPTESEGRRRFFPR